VTREAPERERPSAHPALPDMTAVPSMGLCAGAVGKIDRAGPEDGVKPLIAMRR